MIAFLIGHVTAATAEEILLNVNGVGYRIAAPVSVTQKIRALPQPVTLITHQIFREDSQTLYGFLSEKEEAMFIRIIGVSGIGPKIGLKICSFFSPDQFAQVIIDANIRQLTQIPGVGKKVAERLIMELKDKLPETENPVLVSAESTGVMADLTLALKQLGYSQDEIRQGLQRAKTDLQDDMTLEAGLKMVLKQLL